MAPDLTQQEEDRLLALAGRPIPKDIPVLAADADVAFLAGILKKVIRALEVEDDYQREQREQRE